MRTVARERAKNDDSNHGNRRHLLRQRHQRLAICKKNTCKMKGTCIEMNVQQRELTRKRTSKVHHTHQRDATRQRAPMKRRMRSVPRSLTSAFAAKQNTSRHNAALPNETCIDEIRMNENTFRHRGHRPHSEDVVHQRRSAHRARRQWVSPLPCLPLQPCCGRTRPAGCRRSASLLQRQRR